VKFKYSIGDLVQVNFLVDSEDEKDTQAIYGIITETSSEWRTRDHTAEYRADKAELDNEPHYKVKLTHSPGGDWHRWRWLHERQIELKASP